jgi:hypothetical protein
MQPCPPGTSPWTPWVVAGLSLYVVLALVGVGWLASTAMRAPSSRGKLARWTVTVVVALLAAVGGLAMVLAIGWTGACG